MSKQWSCSPRMDHLATHNPSPAEWLRLSDDVEAMIERAAQSHGTPENVQAWAHRLAEDVRNLTD